MTLEEEILQLKEANKRLEEENQALRLRISELETLLKEALDKLNKDSHNSSKPPSSDMFRKPQSLRTSSGKKPGGQMGHPGTTLRMKEIPDDIVLHEPERCSHCQGTLAGTAPESYEKRQVCDLPPLHLFVTEHRSVAKTCPHCGTVNKGAFPSGVEQAVQYGPELKALCVYLSNYQLLPYGRCTQLLEDLLGHTPCEASMVSMAESCAFALRPFEDKVKNVLLFSDVLHCDETGYYFSGKTNWLHVAATENYTLYHVHEKRGTEALRDMNILPHYKGVAVHDYWPCYLDYGCAHVFCHVHHLRDLTFCIEREKSHWAEEMKELLLQIKQSVEEELSKGNSSLSAEVFGRYHAAYYSIMEQGEKEHPLPQRQKGRRGRIAKSKSRNLWERFERHASEMLRFGCDFSIPFSNNVAEQAVRMMRVKQKISGCFRSKEGAVNFARIRSYIDTLRKQGLSILEWLENALIGEAWLPKMPAPA